MAIIWLIEQDIHLESSAHANLAGNYPVRIISSITSLRSLIRIEKQFYPDVIVINKDLDWDQCNHLINTIHYKLPNSHIIFSKRKNTLKTLQPKSSKYILQKKHYANLRINLPNDAIIRKNKNAKYKYS